MENAIPIKGCRSLTTPDRSCPVRVGLRVNRGHFGAAAEVMDRDGDVDIVVRK